jgi:hypothetical protein
VAILVGIALPVTLAAWLFLSGEYRDFFGTSLPTTRVEQDVGSPQSPGGWERGLSVSEALFSPKRVCPELETNWSQMTCDERHACFATRASDATSSATVATPDLLPIFEARAKMFEALSSAACESLDAGRDAAYLDFTRRFRDIPIS